jgi:hypothetical protein
LQLLPDILDGAFVVGVGGANEVGVLRADLLHERFEIRVHLIGITLWIESVLGGFGGNLVSVFVGADLESHLTTILALVAGPYVSKQIIERVADMRSSVDIRNGCGDVEIFSHWSLV